MISPDLRRDIELDEELGKVSPLPQLLLLLQQPLHHWVDDLRNQSWRTTCSWAQPACPPRQDLGGRFLSTGLVVCTWRWSQSLRGLYASAFIISGNRDDETRWGKHDPCLISSIISISISKRGNESTSAPLHCAFWLFINMCSQAVPAKITFIHSTLHCWTYFGENSLLFISCF